MVEPSGTGVQRNAVERLLQMVDGPCVEHSGAASGVQRNSMERLLQMVAGQQDARVVQRTAVERLLRNLVVDELELPSSRA